MSQEHRSIPNSLDRVLPRLLVYKLQLVFLSRILAAYAMQA